MEPHTAEETVKPDAAAAYSNIIIGEALSLRQHYSGPTQPVGVTLFTLLRIVTVIVTASQCVLFALQLWNGAVHMQMFTYWHQVMFTVFLLALTVSLFVEGWPLLVTLLVLLPLETGLTLIVSIAVVILIRENPAILLKGTTCDGGTMSMGDVHTGDFVVHDFGPLLLYGCEMVAGLWLTGRTVIGQTWAHLKTPWHRVAYATWFLLAPLLPLFVYSVTLGIHKHYPTNVPDYLLWLALLPVALAVQSVVWLSFVLDANVTLQVPLLSEVLDKTHERWVMATTPVVYTPPPPPPPPQQQQPTLVVVNESLLTQQRPWQGYDVDSNATAASFGADLDYRWPPPPPSTAAAEPPRTPTTDAALMTRR